MNTREIWLLHVDQRIAAFIERYEELDESVGCRTAEMREEMNEIALAIMPTLIKRMTKAEAAIKAMALNPNDLCIGCIGADALFGTTLPWMKKEIERLRTSMIYAGMDPDAEVKP